MVAWTGVARAARNAVGWLMAIAMAAAGAVAPIGGAAPAAASLGCDTSISGTITNQLGKPVTHVSIRLLHDDGDWPHDYEGVVDSRGRFTFDQDRFGFFGNCLVGDASYRITVVSDDLLAPERARWYSEQTIWRGRLADRANLRLDLKATVLGRIKTSTKGASSVRAPAYSITNPATGKVVRKAQAAPLNIGPGSVDYITVPAGTYKVTMVPKSGEGVVAVGTKTKTVTVRAGATTAVQFAIKAGGALSGRIKEAAGLTKELRTYGVQTGDDWWDDLLDDKDYARCSQRDNAIGTVVAVKRGSTFRAKGCLATSGKFSLTSLPAGTYSVKVMAAEVGAPSSTYVMKNGKKAWFKVKPGVRRSLGSVKLTHGKGMVRGTITLPKVAHADCEIGLIDSKGRNVAYTYTTVGKNTKKNTKIAYRVWGSSGKKTQYRVRYLCGNDEWYSDFRWESEDPDARDTLPARWYSGGGRSLASAKPVAVRESKPATVNVTIKGSKRASVGTPVITGSPKVGKELRVKIPGLAKNGKTLTEWLVNGKLWNDCWDEHDCYSAGSDPFYLGSEYAGARVQARITVWQDHRWTVVKTTRAVTIR